MLPLHALQVSAEPGLCRGILLLLGDRDPRLQVLLPEGVAQGLPASSLLDLPPNVCGRVPKVSGLPLGGHGPPDVAPHWRALPGLATLPAVVLELIFSELAATDDGDGKGCLRGAYPELEPERGLLHVPVAVINGIGRPDHRRGLEGLELSGLPLHHLRHQGELVHRDLVPRLRGSRSHRNPHELLQHDLLEEGLLHPLRDLGPRHHRALDLLEAGLHVLVQLPLLQIPSAPLPPASAAAASRASAPPPPPTILVRQVLVVPIRAVFVLVLVVRLVLDLVVVLVPRQRVPRGALLVPPGDQRVQGGLPLVLGRLAALGPRLRPGGAPLGRLLGVPRRLGVQHDLLLPLQLLARLAPIREQHLTIKLRHRHQLLPVLLVSHKIVLEPVLELLEVELDALALALALLGQLLLLLLGRHFGLLLLGVHILLLFLLELRVLVVLVVVLVVVGGVRKGGRLGPLSLSRGNGSVPFILLAHQPQYILVQVTGHGVVL
mmetsp:Transcript_919/g.2875  ORF Transcript_919/g.2875 Transcript_919/m.2875 type:complete len:491 (-) Transcript_919:166-1638(-)